MPQSNETTQIGGNRTGVQTSPELTEQMNEVVRSVSARAADAEASPLNEVRVEYIREADPLGSMPDSPRAQAFIDKLAERLAYERGGTRLYDAVIAKFVAQKGEMQDASLQELIEIRDEEAGHAALLRTCIEQLGGDPTVQTPSADVVGVATSGFLQVAADPRTTLAHSLQVALAAELVDVASWEVLISMAETMDQDAMVERFRKARDRENEHVAKVRGWFETLTLGSSERTAKKSRSH